MAVEIERKYLVDQEKIDSVLVGIVPKRIKQTYLNLDKNRSVRVRQKNDVFLLTIKGASNGLSRAEFEYIIPKEDGAELLKMGLKHPIEKLRYEVKIDHLVWEIDVFGGVNEGLILAEVELPNENHVFKKPDWIGDEVSMDARYFNLSLYQNPFGEWINK